ncbi:acyltransferase family protein [Rickettsia endosymbiont of Halotydeus destructor]|uniref:acyltransferase family protein n=1 Tax=Rickettsia endosymbiont of Halotydeus destructor TaxID=2996754 RepID=UPI003BAEA173
MKVIIERDFFVFLLAVGIFVIILTTTWILSRLIPILSSEAHPESKWLDGLRGIAAMLVALTHVQVHIIKQEYTLFHFTGALGVQLFFCITGMLFAHKIIYAKVIDWTLFYKKRLLRIVPAYFCACIVALMLTLWSTWPVKQSLLGILPELPKLLSFGLLPLPIINGFNLANCTWSELDVSYRMAILCVITDIIYFYTNLAFIYLGCYNCIRTL